MSGSWRGEEFWQFFFGGMLAVMENGFLREYGERGAIFEVSMATKYLSNVTPFLCSSDSSLKSIIFQGT